MLQVEHSDWLKRLSPVVVRLNKALNEALALSGINARLSEMAAKPTPVTPASFETVPQA